MAITVVKESADVIEPDELLDWAIKNADPRDDDSMVACAPRLSALANNREFMRNSLCDELRLIAAGKSRMQRSPQAYVHGSRKAAGRMFTIRSVLWTPPLATVARSRVLQDRGFSYVTPHDHNFGLLTVGYLGSGYETVLYEYDPTRVVGFAGEDVEIEYLETLTLSVGKVLYYRPRRDIHIQRHPSEISVSLNLISEGPNIDRVPQFQFDVDKRKIVGLLRDNDVKTQMLPFAVLSLLGADDNLVDLVLRIAQVHESEHIRSAAYRAVASVRPKQLSELTRSGLDDKHPLVRSEIRSMLS